MNKLIVGVAVQLMLLMTSLLSAQENCVTGKVLAAENPGQAMVGAEIKLFVNEVFVASELVDFDGNFWMCGLPDTGIYDLQIDNTGYVTKRITDIPFGADSLVLELNAGEAVDLIYIHIACPTIISADEMGSGQTFNDEQIVRGIPFYQNGRYVTRNTPQQLRRIKRIKKRKAARKKQRK